MTASIETDAAFLSGAAMAEAALYGGMDTCLPFKGLRWLALLEVWRQVFDDCVQVCRWPPDTRNLAATFVEETLPRVQHCMSRVVGNCARAPFLAAFEMSTDQGQRVPHAC